MNTGNGMSSEGDGGWVSTAEPNDLPTTPPDLWPAPSPGSHTLGVDLGELETRPLPAKPQTLPELFHRCRVQNRIRQQQDRNPPAKVLEKVPQQPVRSVFLQPTGEVARGLLYHQGVPWFVSRERGLREELACG